jgi:hypothetical protein
LTQRLVYVCPKQFNSKGTLRFSDATIGLCVHQTVQLERNAAVYSDPTIGLCLYQAVQLKRNAAV